MIKGYKTTDMAAKVQAAADGRAVEPRDSDKLQVKVVETAKAEAAYNLPPGTLRAK